jgi:trans-aconitate methyltransferase
MSKDRIRDHYEQRLDADTPGFQAADWADRDSQIARFGAMTDHVDLAGKRLVDIGCGVGDLLAFLQDRKIECEYLGIDLLESVIIEAQRRHPDASFLAGDIFAPGITLPRPVDVIFASGVFNLDMGNNREFLPNAIDRLGQLAGEAIAFNLLHARTPDQSDYCVYWDPKDIFDMFTTQEATITIIDDYLPNDFTVICRK